MLLEVYIEVTIKYVMDLNKDEIAPIPLYTSCNH